MIRQHIVSQLQHKNQQKGEQLQCCDDFFFTKLLFTYLLNRPEVLFKLRYCYRAVIIEDWKYDYLGIITVYKYVKQ